MRVQEAIGSRSSAIHNDQGTSLYQQAFHARSPVLPPCARNLGKGPTPFQGLALAKGCLSVVYTSSAMVNCMCACVYAHIHVSMHISMYTHTCFDLRVYLYIHTGVQRGIFNIDTRRWLSLGAVSHVERAEICHQSARARARCQVRLVILVYAWSKPPTNTSFVNSRAKANPTPWNPSFFVCSFYAVP